MNDQNPIISDDFLKQCYAHGVESYPEEACGFISGSSSDQLHMDTLHPMENLMNLHHERDPENFPRTNKDGYLMDPRKQMKLERTLKKAGSKIKIIYHSHPDVGAYFSEKDQEDALWNGEPRTPGVDFLVCAVTDGKPDGAVLFSFDESTKAFKVKQSYS